MAGGISIWEAKLAGTTMAQQEIEGLSKEVRSLSGQDLDEFVKGWEQVSAKQPSLYLILMYVANDVVQKAKAAENEQVLQKMGSVLEAGIENMVTAPPETRKKINRVLMIWKDRGVYPDKVVKNLQQVLGGSTMSFVGSVEEEDDQIEVLPMYRSDDDDDDDDDDDGGGVGGGISGKINNAGGGEISGVAPLRRAVSNVSLQELALSRIVSVTKSRSKKCVTNLEQAIDEMNRQADYLESSEGKQRIENQNDTELVEMYNNVRKMIKDSHELDKDANECKILENGLASALEEYMETTESKYDDYDERLKNCDKALKRLERLRQAHPKSEALQVTVQVEKTRLISKNSRKRTRSDSESSEDDDDDDDENDDEEDEEDDDDENVENGKGEGEGGDGKKKKNEKKKRRKSAAGKREGGAGDVLVVKKKKKKKKKVVKEEEVEKVPMMYNKITKSYVPVVRTDNDESWRDH